jgi:hypothetical protein
MRHHLITILAAAAVAATTACSEAATQPTAVETEALIASATAWTPSDITRGLQVDEATRQKIEAGVQSLHTSLLALHERHENAQTLEGDARAAYMTDIHENMIALHEQHKVLWDSLDPAVRETIATRLHEQMRHHDDDAANSIHERMRRLHGGDHDADGAGH